jgi:hypothetical protein
VELEVELFPTDEMRFSQAKLLDMTDIDIALLLSGLLPFYSMAERKIKRP